MARRASIAGLLMARLAFRHPVTGARVEFRAPLPGDLKQLIDALGKRP